MGAATPVWVATEMSPPFQFPLKIKNLGGTGDLEITTAVMVAGMATIVAVRHSGWCLKHL